MQVLQLPYFSLGLKPQPLCLPSSKIQISQGGICKCYIFPWDAILQVGEEKNVTEKQQPQNDPTMINAKQTT